MASTLSTILPCLSLPALTLSLSSLFNIPPFLVKMAKYFISSKLIAWELPAFDPRAAVCQAAGRESPTGRSLGTGAAFFLPGSSSSLHSLDGINTSC